MKSAKNIIDKIFLDFTYKTNGRDKTAVTDGTRTFFYDNLLPKIDGLLTARGKTANIRIESLTIDLEKISLEDLPYKLLSELEAQLDRHASSKVSTANSRALKSDTADDIDTLIYFLQTGNMPWHHDSTIYPDQVFAAALKEDRKQLVTRLRQTFVTMPVSLERFLLQFKEWQIANIFNHLLENQEYANILKGWYEYVRTGNHPELLSSVFNFVVHDRAFMDKRGFINSFTAEVIAPHLNAGKPILPEIAAELQNLITHGDNAIQHTNTEKDIAAFFKTLEKEYRGKQATSRSKRTAAPPEDKKSAIADRPPQPTGENAENQLKNNSFKVDNAGLVVLYPYLQMFFTELKLVKGETFVSKAAQHKAVQVLHYLSTGNLKTPEHLLALNKTMCGVDMARPVPARLRLTKEQKEACEVLLNAAIKNWPPLKNTSIEGFRQSFLQRSASLKKDDKDWILYIEKKGIDILLEQLPWGFSIMKYPWNEYLIHVQW